MQAKPDFILYSRSSCALCDAIEEELIPVIERYQLTIVRIFIDNDEELERRFGSRVPVLVRHGRVICETFLDEAAVHRALSG